MKKLFVLIFAFLASFMMVMAPVPVFADCGGVPTKGPNGPDEIKKINDGEGKLKETVSHVLTAIFGIMGIISAVVIIIAGIMYMTSAGDPGKVATAKKAILYAIIGLIVALSAFAITNFILEAL